MKKRVSVLLTLTLCGLIASCAVANGDNSSEVTSNQEDSSINGTSENSSSSSSGSSQTGSSSNESSESSAGESSSLPSESSSSSSSESVPSSSSESSSSESSSDSSDSSGSSSSSSSEPTPQTKVVSLDFGTSAFNNRAATTKLKSSSITSNGVTISYSGSYVYQESASTALKFASQSNEGVLTLSFDKKYNISSVAINAFKFGSDNATLNVQGASYSKGLKVEASSYSASSFLSYASMNDATDTLTIKANKKNRCYVASIKIVIAGEGGTIDTPDTPTTPSKPASGEEGYYSLSLDEVQKMSLASYPEYDIFGGNGLPTTGNPKLLVVPVYFAGDTAPSKAELDIVKTAFFGEEGETKFPSLSAYYKKSSYGNLNIGGVVTEAFQYSQSASAFQSSFENGEKTTDDVLADAISWAKSKGYLNNTFDTNDDGYYDGIDLIYFTDKDENDNEDLWWAYTTCVEEEGSASNPVPCRYFWSPMSMISNGYYSPDIDTHTLIHETGHMLGLDDYYSYDKTSSGSYKESPAAMVDMMDCNVGDHDAFSKMLMGWTAPKVVTGTGNFSITLSSFEETGEFLLIPASSYNNTVFDEYMILQYYTPTGLNALDSTGYPEWASNGYGHGGTYAASGLQAFHVDARLWSVQYNDNTGRYSNVSYATDPSESEVELSNNVYKLNYGIAASNSGSYSLNVEASRNASGTANTFSNNLTYNSKNRLITALPASGSAEHLSSNFESMFGDNSILYTLDGNSSYTNSKLSACYQNNGKFNNGETFPYSFSITAQTNDSITISFTSL